MFAFLSDFFQKIHIELSAPIALSECTVVRPYLLERAGISDGTVILFAVPYYSRAAAAADRNLSAYAVPEDYHAFFAALFRELLPLLQERFPRNRFAGFSDHSPILEVEAAARAGLGVIGKNRLLLTEKYSSYIFLGELITDAILPSKAQAPSFCRDCGACSEICPMQRSGICLSSLTQKKGALTKDEISLLREGGSAWGCDKCQEVCPYTKRALQAGTIFSPIPYFQANTIASWSPAALDDLSDADFSKRAFSWRGRETIRRNLTLLTPDHDKKGEPTC